MEVASLLAQGYTSKQISLIIKIPVGAVNKTIERARSKLGLKNRTQLAVYFFNGDDHGEG